MIVNFAFTKFIPPFFETVITCVGVFNLFVHGEPRSQFKRGVSEDATDTCSLQSPVLGTEWKSQDLWIPPPSVYGRAAIASP